MDKNTELYNATAIHLGKKITYINGRRNMSIDCDYGTTTAHPVVTPCVRIFALRVILF